MRLEQGMQRTAESSAKRGALRLVAAALAILAVASAACAETLVTLDGKEHEVAVLRISEEGIVVKAPGGAEKLYAFDDLEAKSACEFYGRAFRADDAKGRVKVARYCIGRKLLDRAKAELVEAKRLDPALAAEADRIWAEALGDAPRPPLSEDQVKAIVAEQLSRGKTVEDAVGEKVYTLETEHFVIYTTFPKNEHAAIKSLSEKLYQGLDRLFEISKNDDRMWDGKCVLYFFKDREGFVKFATKVHGFPGQTAGGYFRARGGQCEVVIPNLAGSETFKETMVHEGTHAFLHFFRAAGRVPRWIQEGTAQYFEFEEFPKARMLRAHNRAITAAVKAGRILGITELQESDRPQLGTDVEGYAWCYTYVSYLIHKDPKKYAEFVRQMKSGLAPEEALKAAFGWDFKALQQNWLKAVEHLRG